jgi:hypothetical protein
MSTPESESESVYEKYIRIGAKYNLSGPDARHYFVTLVGDTPPKVRPHLFRPEWVAGFVAGVVYNSVKPTNPPMPPVPGEDFTVLYRIVMEAIKRMEQVPYVGDKN